MNVDNSDKMIAHHEAAHAIAALALGVKLKHATIIPKNNSCGHVIIRRIWSHPPLRLMVVACAGPLAEEKYRALNGIEPNSYHGGSDVDVIRDSLKRIYIDNPGAVPDDALNFTDVEALKIAGCRAKELVDLYWAQIVSVADMLVRRKKLNEGELQRLLGRTIRRKKQRGKHRSNVVLSEKDALEFSEQQPERRLTCIAN
jgi:hypothetical protein